MTIPTPGTTAKPGPRPGARPTRIHNDPAQWGRVDEDGTAWVRTADGERQVGNYQAGTPAEGLAHFGARFDALATQVTVLESRVQTHGEDAHRIMKEAQALHASLATANVIGDLDTLAARLEKLIQLAEQAREDAKAAAAERKAQATAKKEALAAEAEAIAEAAKTNTVNFKNSGDRFAAMFEEWKTTRGVDAKVDESLWQRFRSARETFNELRRGHFDQLDKQRAAAAKKKQQLVEQAEALADSTDFGETARTFRELMDEWKRSGRAGRKEDDALWARFRGAQDRFFAARDADLAKRDETFAANADAKQALLDKYDSLIAPAEGLDQAKAALRELQEQWEAIGFVPRNRVREFEDKIDVLERRVADAEAAEWRKSDPEVLARVEQFQSKADQFAAEAEAAAAAGNDAKAAKLRAQADQWNEWAAAARAAVDS